MQSRSYLFLLLVLGLAILSGVAYTQFDYKYGLDVRGGVRFTYEMDESQLTPEQRREIGLVRNQMLNVLERRVSQALGVVEGTVQLKGRNQFIVELPGETDIERARSTINTSASIRIYHATNVVTEKRPNRRYQIYPDDNTDPNRPSVSFIDTRNPDKVLQPGDPEYVQMIKGWDLILQGDDLARAGHSQSPGGVGYVPLMNFSPDGSRKMRTWTTKFRNTREMIASVLDNEVLSIASLENNTILSDNAIITGQFTNEYVRNLADLLNAGALPVDLRELSSQRVDPTIGQNALDKMVVAGAIAFGVIALYLIAYYAFPGFVALLALVLYCLFTLTVLKTIGATFSLAAIAGFILSVGMAVDANILVFERFKEEMKAGRSLNTAIELGFRRALPAIVDSNACTILTSLVLANLGTGPVKGFAITLIIGVAISLFTTITVTRSLLVFLVGSGLGSNPKWYALERSWFGERFEQRANTDPLKIVQSSKKWFLISGITILVGLPFIFMGGLKPNVEFQGGYEFEFRNSANLTLAQVRSRLEASGIQGANAKFAEGAGGMDLINVTLPLDAIEGAQPEVGPGEEPAPPGGAVEDPAGPDADPDQAAQPEGGTDDDPGATTGTAEDPAEPGTDEDQPAATAPRNEVATGVSRVVAEALQLNPSDLSQGGDLAGSSSIGPTVRNETVRNAILGVLISTALIVIYLAFRFGLALGNFIAGLRFGFSAIGALIHDILVVLGITAIVGYFFNWEVSALFITSMLTVIGFSVHDTIVIFDRIRENLRRPLAGEDFAHLVNRSVTQSFARSINTSITVIATLVILLFWGTTTPDLKLFMVTMLAGILSGTYSSIYNASPILYLWDMAVKRNKGEDATFVGIAAAEAARARAAKVAMDATPTPAQAQQPTPGAGKYGQVRRRGGATTEKKGFVEIDEDEQK